jgi:hypothetical protein
MALSQMSEIDSKNTMSQISRRDNKVCAHIKIDGDSVLLIVDEQSVPTEDPNIGKIIRGVTLTIPKTEVKELIGSIF